MKYTSFYFFMRKNFLNKNSYPKELFCEEYSLYKMNLGSLFYFSIRAKKPAILDGLYLRFSFVLLNNNFFA